MPRDREAFQTTSQVRSGLRVRILPTQFTRGEHWAGLTGTVISNATGFGASMWEVELDDGRVAFAVAYHEMTRGVCQGVVEARTRNATT